MKTWSFFLCFALLMSQNGLAQGLTIRRDRNSLVISYRGRAERRPNLYELACSAVEEIVKERVRPAQYNVVREYGGPGYENEPSFASVMLSDFFAHPAIAQRSQSDLYWLELIRVAIWLAAPWIAPNSDREEDTILYALGGAAEKFAKLYGNVL